MQSFSILLSKLTECCWRKIHNWVSGWQKCKESSGLMCAEYQTALSLQWVTSMNKWGSEVSPKPWNDAPSLGTMHIMWRMLWKWRTKRRIPSRGDPWCSPMLHTLGTFDHAVLKWIILNQEGSGKCGKQKCGFLMIFIQGEIVWLGNFHLKREMTEGTIIHPDNHECNEESE